MSQLVAEKVQETPKEELLAQFEKAHFAGVEEMRTNDRLFQRVAPLAINDLVMAYLYKFKPASMLEIPVTSFDGLSDNTIEPGTSKSSYICTMTCYALPCKVSSAFIMGT